MKSENPKTLRDIIEEHPEWLDLPVGIYTDNDWGDEEYYGYDMVGRGGSVYFHQPDEDERDPDGYQGAVVVFSGN